MTSFTHEQFLETMARINGEKVSGEAQQTLFRFQTIAREAVEAERLTGDPHWDIFLSYLQAVVKEAEAERNTARAVIESPQYLSDELLQSYRHKLLLAGNALNLLGYIMQLPGEIMRDGEQATDLLTRLHGAEDGDTKS